MHGITPGSRMWHACVLFLSLLSLTLLPLSSSADPSSSNNPTPAQAARSHRRAAEEYTQKKEYTSALSSYLLASSLEPTNPTNHLQRYKVYRRLSGTSSSSSGSSSSGNAPSYDREMLESLTHTVLSPGVPLSSLPTSSPSSVPAVLEALTARARLLTSLGDCHAGAADYAAAISLQPHAGSSSSDDSLPAKHAGAAACSQSLTEFRALQRQLDHLESTVKSGRTPAPQFHSQAKILYGRMHKLAVDASSAGPVDRSAGLSRLKAAHFFMHGDWENCIAATGYLIKNFERVAATPADSASANALADGEKGLKAFNAAVAAAAATKAASGAAAVGVNADGTTAAAAAAPSPKLPPSSSTSGVDGFLFGLPRVFSSESLISDLHDPLGSSADALSAQSQRLLAYNLRALSYLHLGELSTSLTHYKEGLRIDPEHAELKAGFKHVSAMTKNLKRGDDAYAAGEVMEAVNHWTKAALESDKPGSGAAGGWKVDVLAKAVDGLIKLGKVKDAIVLAKKATAVKEGVESLGKLADALVADEQFDEAHRILRQGRDGRENSNEERQKYDEKIKIVDVALKQSKTKDYYKILGVARTADKKEVKKGYKDQAMIWHPDKNAGNEEEASKKFQEIAEAYEVLSDDELKAKYDRGEDPLDNRQQGGGHNPFGHAQHGGQQHFHFRHG